MTNCTEVHSTSSTNYLPRSNKYQSWK